MAQAAPTADEISAAQAVLDRAAAAQEQERQARYKPIADITAGKPFAQLRDAMEALPAELLTDPNLAPHIMAVRAGLNGLAIVAPVPA